MLGITALAFSVIYILFTASFVLYILFVGCIYAEETVSMSSNGLVTKLAMRFWHRESLAVLSSDGALSSPEGR